MIYIIAATCYVGLVWAHWGLLYAYLQRSWPSIAASERREDCSMSLLFSLIPFAWLLTPFFTGFYEHGWLNPLTAFGGGRDA